MRTILLGLVAVAGIALAMPVIYPAGVKYKC